MIELKDPAWDSLRSHCQTGKEVSEMLASYEVEGLPDRDDLYEDLLDLGCGGQFYSAGYAAVPHLVRLARGATPLKAAILLNTAAFVVYYAGREGSDPVESRFSSDFPAACTEARAIAEKFADHVEASAESRQLRLSMSLFAGDREAFRKGIEES